MAPGAGRTTLSIIPTRYAAPEILFVNAKPDDYTEKSDVFSMGVLMWEAYSRGELPWSQIERDEDVVRQVMNGDLLPQPQNCSQAYWSIIIKTWAKSPNDRPTFSEGLKRFLAEQNYNSEPKSSHPPKPPPQYRNPELEKIIVENASNSKLDLGEQWLRVEDMEIVAYYALQNNKYAGINIGPVHRKDIIRASTQLEREPQWAVVLAFDVRVEKDAQEHADAVGIKIFQADIIYHLFDMFLAHRERVKKENQEKFRHLAVFPCKLKILPQYIFNTRDPIICGVIVEDGFVRLGTSICVPSKEFVDLGRIVSIELNHKPLEIARKGSEVCIKIEPVGGEAPRMYSRHFDENDLLMSKISRKSIDIVKDHFRDDMQKSD